MNISAAFCLNLFSERYSGITAIFHSILYCFFWGFAAVAWIKLLYPRLSALIEKIPVRTGKILSWIIILFMICNMAVSGLALIRSTQRDHDIPALYKWQQVMDERFDDQRLARIYPNAIKVQTIAGSSAMI